MNILTCPIAISPNYLEALVPLIAQYAQDNIAVVNYFLKTPFVESYLREEKINVITFVGSMGGLLGLFTGFSFLSVKIGRAHV